LRQGTRKCPKRGKRMGKKYWFGGKNEKGALIFTCILGRTERKKIDQEEQGKGWESKRTE